MFSVTMGREDGGKLTIKNSNSLVAQFKFSIICQFASEEKIAAFHVLDS